MMMSALRDLRFAVRLLTRQPGFTALAAGTIAIGVGAVSTVFSLVNAVLIDGLPFERADRLIFMRGVRTAQTPQPYPLGVFDIEALAGSDGVFSGVSPLSGLRPFNLRAGTETAHVSAEMVGAEYFRILGVRMAAGRAFTADEASLQTPVPVAILSDALWRTQFGAAPTVLDGTIDLNDRRYQVIGVAPPSFRGVSDDADLWLPIGMAGPIYGPHYTNHRQFRWLSAIGRLDDRTELTQAQQAIDLVAARLREAFPVEHQQISYALMPLGDVVFGSLRAPLLTLLAGAAFLLLLASVNVANLLLARSTARAEELAVRRALGADRRRLAAQLAWETATLCAVGAAGGLVLAAILPRIAYLWAPEALRQFVVVRFDPLVVLAALTCTTLAAVIAGVLPAALMLRRGTAHALRTRGQAGSSGAAQRWQRTLVAGEVAVAVALLIAAAAMTRGLRQFTDIDLGLTDRPTMTLRLDLTAERFKDNAAYFAMAREVFARASGVAGVDALTIEGPGFPTSGSFGITFRRVGGAPNDPDIQALRHHVMPGYFGTLGITLLTGRDFGPQDAAGGAGALIVSRAFAEAVWPGQSAVGQRLAAGTTPDAPILTVIGVAENVRHAGRTTASSWAPEVYLNLLQFPPRTPAVITVMATTDGDAERLRQPLIAAVRDASGGLPPFDVQPLAARFASQTQAPRFAGMIMSAFALASLALATIGVFGVVAHILGLRRREIGLRIALGASRGQVLWTMMRLGLMPVAIGIAGGIGLAYLTGGYLSSLLYGLPPTAPLHVIVVVALLGTIAAVAVLVPALRATRIPPSVVLANE